MALDVSAEDLLRRVLIEFDDQRQRVHKDKVLYVLDGELAIVDSLAFVELEETETNVNKIISFRHC